ncbi:MAG: Rpn family recombination-promoting nuclease/putative transposase [Lachnospiraceae bacterium]|nr:Rpn family recombination-promoting nuclease/putative transposase [Lachnospiraceae bacterium]
MKSYDELTFSDSFMFGKVTEDPDICRDIISTLMGEDIGVLSHQPEREKFLKEDAQGKYIKLDILAEDEVGRLYDVEMQNESKNDERRKELPRRSRYYQSMLDITYLKEGAHYRELKDVYIIFLCTFDPFGYGKYCYTFRNSCKEVPELELSDGAERLFFNITSDMKGAPENLRKLLEYMRTGNASDEVTKKIDRIVKMARKNPEWRAEYMKSFTYLMDAKYEGKQEGLQEGKAQSVIELLEEIGPVPQELREVILNEMNLETLSAWHKISARVDSIDEFVEKSGINSNIILTQMS